MGNKRIFIAVNLPAEVKKEIYGEFVAKIPSDKCKVVTEGNLHITMLFLGYWPEEKIPELKKKLNAIEGGQKFKINLNGIGHFKGRIIWLGVREGNEKLRELGKELNNAFGIRDERFHAHVTLARNKSMKRAEVDELLEKLGRESFSAEVEVKSIDLMESVLTPKGPHYSKLFSLNLI